MKTKICSKCGNDCFYWSAKLKACKDCSQRIKAKEASISPVKPRKPLVQYQTKAIKQVSDTQAKRLKRYRIARDEYFKDYPVCQFPNCGSRNITLHHMKGKIGELLWNKKWFKSLCMYHHRIVEESPLESKILNLSANRLDN